MISSANMDDFLLEPQQWLFAKAEDNYPEFHMLENEKGEKTVTITIGFYLMDLDWGLWSKLSLMVFGSFGSTLLLYEYGIRRWKYIRPLFGLKSPKLASDPAVKVTGISLSKQT